MNGNYEWNKQYARQKAQQLRQEAEFRRQARQNHPAVDGQSESHVSSMLASLLPALRNRVTAFSRYIGARTQTEKS